MKFKKNIILNDIPSNNKDAKIPIRTRNGKSDNY